MGIIETLYARPTGIGRFPGRPSAEARPDRCARGARRDAPTTLFVLYAHSSYQTGYLCRIQPYNPFAL